MYHSYTNVNNLGTKRFLGIIEIGYTRTSIHVQIFYQSKTIQKSKVSAKRTSLSFNMYFRKKTL